MLSSFDSFTGHALENSCSCYCVAKLHPVCRSLTRSWMPASTPSNYSRRYLRFGSTMFSKISLAILRLHARIFFFSISNYDPFS